MFHFLEFMCLWNLQNCSLALLFQVGYNNVRSLHVPRCGAWKGTPRKLAFSTIKGWSFLPHRIGRLSLCLFIDYKNFPRNEMQNPTTSQSSTTPFLLQRDTDLSPAKVHRRCLFYSATTPSFYFPCWLETELGLSLEGTGNQQKILVIL